MKEKRFLKLIIHDLDDIHFASLGINVNDFEVINANHPSSPCLGCYHCWLKTPGICNLNDPLKYMGSLLGQSEETVIISQLCYGGYSEVVKRVLDRSISASLPFTTYRSGKLRHRRRYHVDRKCLHVFLYGDYPETEKNTATLLVEANRSNMGFQKANLHLVKQIDEIGGFLR